MSRTILQRVLTEALADLHPGKRVRAFLEEYPVEENDIYLIATGKASIAMAEAAAELLADRLKAGVVIAPYEEASSYPSLEVYRGSHPVPDKHSLHAAGHLISFVERIPAGSAVINCLSGGTSSLLFRPAGDMDIDDLLPVYELLNRSGATIGEINTIRKHLSDIKGGQLLRHFSPGVTLIDLLISDVPGDDPSIIGSGPTTPDASTFLETRKILKTYRLWDQIAGPVRRHIEKGINGDIPETLKPGEDPLKDHRTHIIGSAGLLANKLQLILEEKGFEVWKSESAYNENVQTVAAHIGEKIREFAEARESGSDPVALIFFGESTVEVRGPGKGGRNQELALYGALEIDGREDVTWLSAGTDGIDGPTDAAGALVTGRTISRARKLGLDVREFLDKNDSYHFHERMGTLLKTGPTGNNLMDIQVVLIGDTGTE